MTVTAEFQTLTKHGAGTIDEDTRLMGSQGAEDLEVEAEAVPRPGRGPEEQGQEGSIVSRDG